MHRALVTNKITGARHVPSRLNPGQGAGSQLQNNMRSDIIIEIVRHICKRNPTSECKYVRLWVCLKSSGW